MSEVKTEQVEGLKLTEDMFQRIGKDEKDYDKIVRPSLTYWADAWRRLKENKLAIMSLIILIVVVVMAFIGPLMRPWAYDDQDFTAINKAPDSVHWFGTDDLGRDIFVRCWDGAKISLFVALISTIINVTIGVVYGGISGYVGGRTDLIMMRIIEIIYSIPVLLWVILLMVVLGQGLGTIILAISITGWGGMARIVRGQVLQLKQMEFVLAAQTLGADTSRIILKHLIPNAMGPIIINLTFQVPGAIFTEAMLSYIGLGIPEPTASWGTLAEKGTKMLLIHPYQLLYPALLISITMLAFNILGDGLRDSLDPRLRQ
ncbi:ABC transporter permease [Anaerosalibacter bizertensis]|uniref:ABC transporter permease n=1 Tax=Anaerosalibacter bizertensis TaxID=932217 RepID=A0A844FJU1_9FIRM|nr:ABC transporter permease [Anaerosalibacter bizertensis]MBV1819972.1 ABC transporter permease [Bacteroidales bacterium MSK.15.36]MBU5292906.1 ABC transporter permease [Anaerosalibacter bizertensis]MCG4564132.1 ABC transporter permease [Anaerosalibacter bizertensis]MCG4582562.1 ABC transporter permease [Anaerosalibacter bizertensis]MSS44249.1 ABC transporter permease [Anaerosalibacter bizertensis]